MVTAFPVPAAIDDDTRVRARTGRRSPNADGIFDNIKPHVRLVPADYFGFSSRSHIPTLRDGNNNAATVDLFYRRPEGR